MPANTRPEGLAQVGRLSCTARPVKWHQMAASLHVCIYTHMYIQTFIDVYAYICPPAAVAFCNICAGRAAAAKVQSRRLGLQAGKLQGATAHAVMHACMYVRECAMMQPCKHANMLEDAQTHATMHVCVKGWKMCRIGVYDITHVAIIQLQ